MMSLAKKLGGALRRFVWDRSGTSSIEFAIIFPPFFVLFASGIEAGLLMTRNVMLERSVDIAVRDLRIGTPVPPTFAQFRQSICNATSLQRVVSNCMDNLQVELQPVSSNTWTPLDLEPRCINREADIDPADDTTYQTGENNDFMLVRACIRVDPILPNMALGAILDRDEDEGYTIVVTSAFVNEPSR